MILLGVELLLWIIGLDQVVICIMIALIMLAVMLILGYFKTTQRDRPLVFITSYGVGMKFQETGALAYYSAYKGNGWLYFKWYNGAPVGKTVNFKSVLAHSWGSSSLNSIGVGADSFSLSWTSTTNAWSMENYGVIQY